MQILQVHGKTYFIHSLSLYLQVLTTFPCFTYNQLNGKHLVQIVKNFDKFVRFQCSFNMQQKIDAINMSKQFSRVVNTLVSRSEDHGFKSWSGLFLPVFTAAAGAVQEHPASFFVVLLLQYDLQGHYTKVTSLFSFLICVCVCAQHSLVCSVLICYSLFSFLSSRFCWGIELFSTKLVILS